MKKRRAAFISAVLIVTLLVVGRMLAPNWITGYVNQVIDDVPGYAGAIDDVDLWLLQGAYTIHGLDLKKVESDTEIPFIEADRILFSVQWKALLKGALVGEIDFVDSTLNFVSGAKDGADQFGETVDWTEPIRELMPIEINRIGISDSIIRFVNTFSNPPVDISLNSVEMEVRNIKNVVENDDPLPSPLTLRATSVGDGALSIDGAFNVLKQVPDFNLDVKFEGVALPALNDFLKAYANVDAEQGVFNLYIEMAASDGRLEGYVKPIMTDLKLVSFSKDSEQPLQLIWESLVGLVVEVFENQARDQFASKVPVSGDLNDTEVGVLATIWTLLRNAFVEALKKRTDNEVDFDQLSESAAES